MKKVSVSKIIIIISIIIAIFGAKCAFNEYFKMHIDVTNLGFENLNEMENKMIRAVDYNFDEEEKYIVVSSLKFSGYLFENGYRLNINGEIDEETGVIDTSSMSSGSAEYSYKVIDNDNIDLSNGWTQMTIKNRIISYDGEAVIFDAYLGNLRSDYLVPYTSIDFSHNAEKTTFIQKDATGYNMGEQTGYKLFLK